MDKELGEFVGKGFALLRDRLKAVEARKLPEPIPGKDAVVDYGKIKAMIPEPVPGKDGVVDYKKIEAMIPEPIPGKPGKDAVVDYSRVRAMIPAAVPGLDAFVDYQIIKSMIPAPIPGKDAIVDYARIERMIPAAIPGKAAVAVDGKDGNGIKSAAIDARGNLIITLDDGTKLDAGRAKGKDARQFQGMIATGPSTGSAGGIGDSFETVSKNLGAHPFVLSRTGDVLDSITYTTPTGDTVKSFTYSDGVLASIALSGVLPAGVKTVKTLSYSAGVLAGASYS